MVVLFDDFTSDAQRDAVRIRRLPWHSPWQSAEPNDAGREHASKMIRTHSERPSDEASRYGRTKPTTDQKIGVRIPPSTPEKARVHLASADSDGAGACRVIPGA